MSDEEENNEEEEKEEEEGEEEEDEEKEDGEDEEKEDEEEEEKEDEENNTVKDKKTDTESTSKFETEKLVPSNEIKLDLANGIQNISPLTLSDIPVEKPKSILSILAEINIDMDTLSSELNRTLSIVEYKTQDRENDEMKELLNRASQIVKEIDTMENKPIQVDKGIQSDQDEGYRISQNRQYNHNSPPRYDNRQYMYDDRQLPYDPEKNKSYYSSLNNSHNNIIQNPPSSRGGRGVYNSTRVKRMDNLYQGRQSNPIPLIYSQNEMNGSYPVNDSLTNNNSSYGYSQMPGPQPRQFERYKPGNVSNAMDILLNNH